MRIRDDVGSVHEVRIDRGAFHATTLANREAAFHAKRQSKRAARPMAVSILMTAIGWTCILVLLILALRGGSTRGGTRAWVSWGAWPAILILASTIALGVTLRLRGRRPGTNTLALILREGVCPVCGYDLTGLAPDHANLITCPECSAAWSRYRIGPRSRSQ